LEAELEARAGWPEFTQILPQPAADFWPWLPKKKFKPLIIRDADGVPRACPPGNMAGMSAVFLAGLPVARHPDLNTVHKKSVQSLSFIASRNIKQFLYECSASCGNLLF